MCSIASYMYIGSLYKCARAKVRGVWIKYSFLLGYKRFYRFEGRAGWIMRHKCTIEEWYAHTIKNQGSIIFCAYTAHKQIRVVIGAGNKSQNFAGRWFNSYNTACFVLHKFFTICL